MSNVVPLETLDLDGATIERYVLIQDGYAWINEVYTINDQKTGRMVRLTTEDIDRISCELHNHEGAS